MKKRSLIFLALIMTLASCGNNSGSKARKVINFDDLDENVYHPSQGNTDEIGDFNLLTPFDGAILDGRITFSWEEAENAEKYAIEISSSEFFINDNEAIDYYIQRNIYATSWSPTVELEFQNTTYYWHVIAYNSGLEPKASPKFSFYVQAPEIEEFAFDLGDADDWQLHPLGSYADIAIDDSNFFGNDQESLAISFKKEDTQQGIIESDGWIIVTKTIEKSMYGTDALMFNLYYSGQDADIFIRLVDRDNEYWFAPVKVSNNAKQSVILKFSDFVQRTKDVPVNNEKFDHERIKYFEVVFEEANGDGIMLLSGVKAIKFNNYRNFFIERLDFSNYEESQWVTEGYNFDRVIDGRELTIKYYNGVEGKAKINGYGFAKLVVNQYFYGGDSIKIKIKYTGAKGNNIIIRVYEEDTDRWAYNLPFNSLELGVYSELIIPFSAFAKSDIYGDGKRQFYNIINIQFGVNGQYNTGTVSFKDFEIVKKSDYQTDQYREVFSDGLIEDFNSYQYTSELYMLWNESESNKDEYIQLNSANKVGGRSNPFCGQFEYKSDMVPATYSFPISTERSFSALSIWFKDASNKAGDSRFSHVKNWSAYVSLYITLMTGEKYLYALKTIDRTWNEYVIPFSMFTAVNEEQVPEDEFKPNPLVSENIKDVGFAFQYYYYSVTGNPLPMYTNSNPVYVDNILLTDATTYSKTLKERVVRMDGNIAIVDNFESYEDSSDLESSWQDGFEYDYQHKELSDVVSSEGGNHSMSVDFKSDKESPSYVTSPAIDSEVKGKAVRISLKCDYAITVYVNLYFNVGSQTAHYRATLTAIYTDWAEYAVGLSNFTYIEGSNINLNANYLKDIYKITIGMAYRDGNESVYHLFVDNIIFDYSLSYNVDTRRLIDNAQEDMKMKFKKYAHNPILTRNPKNQWEELCVLNPAVIFNNEDQTFYMLYRAAGNDKQHYIYVGLAKSKDGINFTRCSDKPLIAPDVNGADGGGVEDPRLVKIDDYYFLTYASRPFAPGQYWREDKGYYGFQPKAGPKVLIYNDTETHLAVSKDLVNWKKLGRITDSRQDDRDVVLFPERINGKYYKISRAMYKCGEGYSNPKPAMWISSSSDLLEWREEETLLYAGKEAWEDEKIGASCPPIKTDKGWLLIYHGVASKDKAYRVGAMLLDISNPKKIITKTKDFLMEPEYPFETEGFYSGCVFPTGIVEVKDEYYIYYGAGDQCICLATINKKELLSHLLGGKE